MKVLVTGGAGFIGANFIHYVFKNHDANLEIVNVDCLTYAGNVRNLSGIASDTVENGRYVFECADICDSTSINRIFDKHRPDYVVNFAAESHVDKSIVNPEKFLVTNILGTQTLLDACMRFKIQRFHQVSTDEVYGSLGESGFFTELTPLDPHSPYSASKASADLICQAYSDTYQLPITISRCSNNYGPYQFPEKLIPFTIQNILHGQPLPIYGDGLQIRDWLYVDDHCDAIMKVLLHGKNGEVYNVGGHNEWTNLDIVRLLIRKIRHQLPASDRRRSHIDDNLIIHVEDRKGHDRRYGIDPEKISRELGWTPNTSFEVGLDKTIQWYLENESWVEQIHSGEYHKYNKELMQT